MWYPEAIADVRFVKNQSVYDENLACLVEGAHNRFDQSHSEIHGVFGGPGASKYSIGGFWVRGRVRTSMLEFKEKLNSCDSRLATLTCASSGASS